MEHRRRTTPELPGSQFTVHYESQAEYIAAKMAVDVLRVMLAGSSNVGMTRMQLVDNNGVPIGPEATLAMSLSESFSADLKKLFQERTVARDIKAYSGTLKGWNE